MKKLLTLTLALLLLALPAFASPANSGKSALYKGNLRFEALVFKSPGGEQIGRLKAHARVFIFEVLPAWLKISYKEGYAYIQRDKFDEYTVETINPSLAPAYPGVQNTYLGWVSMPTDVRDLPNENATSLITLNEGTRLAFLGIENGWAKLIFKKQYGYVDTRALGDLQLLNTDLSFSDPDTPIAAYTSFYNIAQTDNNLGRIKNLHTSNHKFSSMVIQPGSNFDFNRDIGPYNAKNGFFPAIVLVDGGSKLGYGGGTCQSASTLYNVVLQLPGIQVLHRRAHGPSGASYLPHGADAAVGNKTQNLRFMNRHAFPIRIDGTAQDGALTIAIYRAESIQQP